MKRSFIIYPIVALAFVSIILVYYSHLNCNEDVKQRYTTLAKELQLETKTLVEQKKEATLLLALSLAKDTRVKESLQLNDYKNLSLKDITDTYTTYTTFKNVWIHLVTANGVSFIKSWTDRRGENILDIRKDIVSFLKSPQVKSLVSVGKYDMTIKAMVPIYDGTKLLGLFEVITKVDSIARELTKEKVLPIVLVDKKYKKQLRHAYTNTFVNDYYIANFDVNPHILEFTKKLDLDKILSLQDDFQIIDNKFLTIYHLKDVHNEEMGYFLLIKNLNTIYIDDIKSQHFLFVFIWLGIMSIVIFIFFYILNKIYTSSLQSEIAIKTKELREFNNQLQKIVLKEVKKNRENEIKLFQQEKILHIAEMFRNIAHHWRQPLSIITTNLSAINLQLELQRATEDEIKKSINGAIQKANELSLNIEFFSKSYQYNEGTQTLHLHKILDDAIKILKPVLDEANIKVIKKYEEDIFEIHYNQSEFINMLVTILQNAYDSLIQTQNDNKTIIIELFKKNSFIYLTIEDNGKGIRAEIISKIFEPYITTKHQSCGVGLSLYFAHNTVVEDLKGSIEAINVGQGEGAKIIIKLPLIK